MQIRDVPDDVRDVLAAQAAARGQSLQVYLLALLSEEARRARNGEVLQRISARGGGSSVTSADVVAALRAARAERDSDLAATQGMSSADEQ